MPSPRLARILIVDDSAVMRSLLRSVVLSDKRLEVVGTAIDGASALRALDSLSPDLILLDVEMPGVDGLSTLKQMKSRGSRVPVIMCSSLTHRGAKVTIEALAAGAADYVAKPTGQKSREAAIQTLAFDLVPRILALTASQTASQNALKSDAVDHAAPFDAGMIPRTVFPGTPGSSTQSSIAHLEYSRGTSAAPPEIVLIGVSTGGPAALDALLPPLPETFPLPILVVQHMPELFTKLLAERLNSRCRMRVVEASSGNQICAGSIYIAKGNWHMQVVPAERQIGPSSYASPVLRLNQAAPENHCRPAVDVLFRSAASTYGARTLGVILTGMGSDGLAGCRMIRERNGIVLAQDQSSSAVWGMPGAVAQAGLAHRVLPLHVIAPEILRLVGRGQREAPAVREVVV